MKVTKKEIESWLRFNPQFRDRARMYEATHFYVTRALGTEYTPAHVQMSIIVHRRLQDILPNDAKGVALEKEWLANEGMEDIVSLATKALTPPGYVRRDGHLFKII